MKPFILSVIFSRKEFYVNLVCVFFAFVFYYCVIDFNSNSKWINVKNNKFLFLLIESIITIFKFYK